MDGATLGKAEGGGVLTQAVGGLAVLLDEIGIDGTAAQSLEAEGAAPGKDVEEASKNLIYQITEEEKGL